MKFNRLFWKFFAAFWLASIVIMAATTYALLNSVQAQRHRDQLQRSLTELVEFIEANGLRHEGREARVRLPRPFAHTAISLMPIIQIFRDGDIWYQYQPNRIKQEPDYTFSIETRSGTHYEIKTLPPKPPKIFNDWIEQKLKVELLLILLVSTVVSFFLSWSVTRPLKQLGTSSRLFARGQWLTQIDPKLSRRGDEFGELARDMTFMMDTVNKAFTAQKQLLHDVSHELRAPLARLQVAAELIQQKDQQSHPQIERIHRECERIDQLIQRILNFSRMEESAEQSEFDVTALIGEQVENAQFENPERIITFASALGKLVYQGYPELLSQSIENILRNACKYTPQESTIELTLTRTHEFYEIAVRDHGQGVSSDDIQRITEPFYRAGNRMHQSGADVGFGLGLSIVQRTIQKHGGKLRIENHPEGGLLITLQLPIDSKVT